jgi:hypothetical protein
MQGVQDGNRQAQDLSELQAGCGSKGLLPPCFLHPAALDAAPEQACALNAAASVTAGEYGYSLLQGDDSGLSPAAIRALPVIVVDPRRSSSGRLCGHSATAGAGVPLLCPHSKAGSAPASLDALAAAGSAAAGLEISSVAAATAASSSSGSDSDEHAGLPLGVHAGATRKLCTICLEEYEAGEKVRVLPCLHRFHVGCIDQWLHSRRLCPVCKHDATKPLMAPPPRARHPGPGDGESHSLGRAMSLLSSGGRSVLGSVGWAIGVDRRRLAQQRAMSAPLTAPLLTVGSEVGEDVETGHLPGSSVASQQHGQHGQGQVGQPGEPSQQPASVVPVPGSTSSSSSSSSSRQGGSRHNVAFVAWQQRVAMLRQQEERMVQYLQQQRQQRQERQQHHEQQPVQIQGQQAAPGSNDVAM